MSDTFDISSILGSGGFGGAVSDLFGAYGSEQAAQAYKKEAQIASENAQISETSSQIQQAQEARAVTQAIGTEGASTAAAGFTMGGNASDLMRQSIQQGALAKSLIAQQGAITTLGFEQQAQAAKGKAAASQTQAGGGLFGGLLKGAIGIASIFSDRRLKENIKFHSIIQGFKFYTYNYKGSDVKCLGVLADEVEKINPEAVTVDPETGFKKVNYAVMLQGVE